MGMVESTELQEAGSGDEVRDVGRPQGRGWNIFFKKEIMYNNRQCQASNDHKYYPIRSIICNKQGKSNWEKEATSNKICRAWDMSRIRLINPQF